MASRTGARPEPEAEEPAPAWPTTIPRLVATDLDGTLLRSDGTVSTRTVRVMHEIADLGVMTILVTARPPRWLDGLSHIVGDHGIAICGNGAFVYDVEERRVVESTGFSQDETLGLVADLRAAIPDISFAAERARGPHIEPEWPNQHRGDDSPAGVIGPIDDIGTDPVGKLLVAAGGLDVPDLLARIREIVGDRGELAYSGAVGLAEINPPGVTKAAGLARWCLGHGIVSDDVWAFGDMPNDVPMLRWSGRSFAVANAHPEAVTAATHRCPSNDDDGVAQVLESVVQLLA